VQELRPLEAEKRVRYCHWFRQFTHDVSILDTTFFSRRGMVSPKSLHKLSTTRIWAAENPHELHQVALRTGKIGLWCAISRRRIIGPIFFDTTVTSAVYADIVQQFVALLNEDEGYCWYQQDGATCHTSNETMTLLKQFFDDRMISKNFWPLRSPDLTPPHFFLSGYQKETVYKNSLRTLVDLKRNIEEAVKKITAETLLRVSRNMCQRENLCLQENGGHFQHLQ
jgi:hypothetical protein